MGRQEIIKELTAEHLYDMTIHDCPWEENSPAVRIVFYEQAYQLLKKQTSKGVVVLAAPNNPIAERGVGGTGKSFRLVEPLIKEEEEK